MDAKRLDGRRRIAGGDGTPPAGAACSLAKIVELPVTMEGMGPMVSARINRTPVRLIADSAPSTARSLRGARSPQLPIQPGPFGLSIIGINGSAPASVATVRTFTLGRVDFLKMQFIVAGSETRGAGVLGQNIFGIADVDYDLPHGTIRLMKSEGRGKANLAYRAEGRSCRLPLEEINPSATCL